MHSVHLPPAKEVKSPTTEISLQRGSAFSSGRVSGRASVAEDRVNTDIQNLQKDINKFYLSAEQRTCWRFLRYETTE